MFNAQAIKWGTRLSKQLHAALYLHTGGLSQDFPTSAKQEKAPATWGCISFIHSCVQHSWRIPTETVGEQGQEQSRRLKSEEDFKFKSEMKETSGLGPQVQAVF